MPTRTLQRVARSDLLRIFESPTNSESWKNVNAATHTPSITIATGATDQNQNSAMCASGEPAPNATATLKTIRFAAVAADIRQLADEAIISCENAKRMHADD